MVLFACNVKKIKGATLKNGDVNGACKQALRMCSHRASSSALTLRIDIMDSHCSIQIVTLAYGA